MTVHLLLCSLKMTFNVIRISETKEQVGKGFLTDVNLKGHAFYSHSSNSSAGGVGLCIRANQNYSIRKDLDILDKEFECIWVKIKMQKSKHTMLLHVQTSYRNTDSKKITEYC